jgi:anti-sigma regulatory factor (Ser/Thr protein kinase)
VIYPYGLTVLCAWLARRQVSFECSAKHWAEDYLDATGFLEAPEMMPDAEPRYDGRNHLGFTPVSSSHRFDSDRTVSRFVDLFREHLDIDDAGKNALAITIAELVENAHRHSRTKTPGFLAAQVHPAKNKLHIAIADSGIGITASFQRGDNSEAKQSIKTDADAVRIACEPLVTSRIEGHAGYGLYVVSQLAQRNGGTFLIASGNALMRRWGERRWGKPPRPMERTCLHAGWQGTVVGIMLDLSRPIPIDDVYNQLPLPRGYAAEDFF